MALEILEELLKEVHNNIDELSFDQILRESRDALGMLAYAVADIVGIRVYRLKQLESGMFRKVPPMRELRILSKLYGISLEVIKEKAEAHVDQFRDKRLKKRHRSVPYMLKNKNRRPVL